MSKLCTLKAIVPGSVIEVPVPYRGSVGEKAILLNPEYTSTKDRIAVQLLRPQDGMFMATNMASMADDTQFNVVEDEPLQKAAADAFVTKKLALPLMGMSCGCDPEVFVEHGNGEIFPAWEFMPTEDDARAKAKEFELTSYYNWDNPTAVITLPSFVPAYWDGAQAEFAPWAKTCLETLHESTRLGMKEVLDFARLKDPNAKLTLRNVIELPEKTLKEADDKHIQFRCSQSCNVYHDPGDGIPNPRQYKFRCAGGHIHLGFTRSFTAPGIEQIVRGLDAVLGVAGVSLAAGIDDPERRHTYGRAGEFRLPEYGIEYRVLSNFWLCHPGIAMLVFELARATVRLAESGLFNIAWKTTEKETRDVINNCDVDGARAILKRNIGVLLGMFDGIWAVTTDRPQIKIDRMRDMAVETIIKGIGSIIADPFDIAGNWKFRNENAWSHHCHGKDNNWETLSWGNLDANADGNNSVSGVQGDATVSNAGN